MRTTQADSQVQQPEQQPHPRPATLTALGALLLAVPPPSVEVLAGAMVHLLPLGMVVDHERAAKASLEAAKLVTGLPPLPSAKPDSESGLQSLAELHAHSEAVYRAWYLLNTAKRLYEGEKVGNLAGAMEAEKRYLSQHEDAARLRGEAFKATDAAVVRSGWIQTWKHGDPEHPRPSHLAADGMKFDLRQGVPVLTGALPGELPGCTCSWAEAS